MQHTIESIPEEMVTGSIKRMREALVKYDAQLLTEMNPIIIANIHKHKEAFQQCLEAHEKALLDSLNGEEEEDNSQPALIDEDEEREAHEDSPCLDPPWWTCE